jgi:hypothetical protein
MRKDGSPTGPTRRDRWSQALGGVVTVVAFTEAGRMHRARISRRVLAVAGLLVLILLIGSTTSVLRLFRGHVDLARMTYLEQENRSLTSLLEGQAEQLSRLKLEVARLKEFEQALRVVSGMDAHKEAVVDPTPMRSEKEKNDSPRKR